jgi:uncharacterized protein YndB with AHSA1/START domain
MTELGMLREDGVRFERLYTAGAEEVWAALTEPESLTRWLAPHGAVLEPNGRFELRMSDAEKADVWGAVRVFDPPRTLELEWRYEGEDDSVLRIELEPRGQETLLVLDHRLLRADQAVGYSAGWHAYLDALDDLLAGRAPGDWDERFRSRLDAYRALSR